ncbi:hypothetical protein Q1695_006377 [Nippostrongylus brasiliensis]|nr:hypothetical protein Q1695_006377 [Nippostrongylus brasiliensis]
MSRMYHPRALQPKPVRPVSSGSIRHMDSTPTTSASARHRPYPRARVLSREVYRGPPSTHQAYEEDVVLEEEVAIGEQQELPPGNVGVRREFVVDSPPTQSPVATPRKLAECLENTVLDMLRAAMFINRNRFSTQATYKEFVQAAAASSISRYSYDGFEGIADFETFRTLSTIASQFFADITTAKAKLRDKKGTNISQTLSAQGSRRQEFSIANCVQQWLLFAEEPFREGLDLRSTVQRWFPNPSQSVSVQAVSMFRFLLQKLTDPPPAIQSYAVRELFIPKSMASNQNKDEGTRKKKESIVDLSRFIDKKIRVKFQGGREASGILKGYDALLNLVLDNCVEYLRDPENPGTVGDDTRSLGKMNDNRQRINVENFMRVYVIDR